MKRIFLVIVCTLLVGCAGSDFGANGTLKGRIMRAVDTPPGSVDAEVFIKGQTGYKGPSLRAPINPDDGTFEISIDLGTESLGPPVVYVNSASFDLYLKVKGNWWVNDTTATEAKPFMLGVIVEANRTTDIGAIILDWPGGVSIWQ